MIENYNIHETLVQSANGKSPLIQLLRDSFDEEFYKKAFPECLTKDVEPFLHYLIWGFNEQKLPNPHRNVIKELMNNPEVSKYCGFSFKNYINNDYSNDKAATYNIYIKFHAAFYERMLTHRIQEIYFPTECQTAKKIMVIVVPEINFMGGGVYSLFSIANTMHTLRHQHDYKILVMTRPNFVCQSFFRQIHFRTQENVFRFEQIIHCESAETLYIHIPEVFASTFIQSLHADVLEYLKKRKNLFINIANQNIQLMPEKEQFQNLRDIATEITQSVAHHAYFNQECSNHYNLPTTLLPAYVDISSYPSSNFDEKENLIIYSPDYMPCKPIVLEKLKEHLPHYKLVEINGITFDHCIELSTRCRFVISFGEGFDGYLLNGLLKNGCGFGIYNDQFFPDPTMKDFYIFFDSGESMTQHIVEKIKRLESDRNLYEEINKKVLDIYNRFYNKEEYIKRISNLVKRQFELRPALALTKIDTPLLTETAPPHTCGV